MIYCLSITCFLQDHLQVPWLSPLLVVKILVFSVEPQFYSDALHIVLTCPWSGVSSCGWLRNPALVDRWLIGFPHYLQGLSHESIIYRVYRWFMPLFVGFPCPSTILLVQRIRSHPRRFSPGIKESDHGLRPRDFGQLRWEATGSLEGGCLGFPTRPAWSYEGFLPWGYPNSWMVYFMENTNIKWMI